MQLPRVLSPAFCCLLTLAVQHVAGLAMLEGEAPTVCPPSCLEIIPSGYTPEVINSWFQTECGDIPVAEQERQAAFIKDLFISFKKLGQGSEIDLCLCKNKKLGYRRLELDTDLEQIFHYDVIARVGFITPAL